MASVADRQTKPSSVSPQDKGRAADEPSQIPVQGWKEIALRTWKESSKDNVSLVAAGVAFYGFLALVPLLGATVLTYGLVASPQTVLKNVQSLATSLPKDAARLIGDQLLNVVRTSSGKKGLGLLLALAVAIWGARNAAGSIIIALNIAYEEEEKRGFLRVTLLSLGMTAAGVFLAMIAAAVLGLLAALDRLLPGLGPVGVVLAKVMAYLFLAGLAAAAAATLYRYGPSRAKAKWSWITPGTVLFGIGWVILTFGFGLYVSHFAKYNVTYGSLGGVIVLVTWLYLSSFILLLGGEFNSEIEHQTARDTTAQAGERPLGERGAWSADHVADGAADEGKEGEPQREQPLSDEPGQRSATSKEKPPVHHDHQREQSLIAARATNRAARLAGLRNVGLISSVVSTIGLSLLRKRGREGAGAALLAAAAGMALLQREH